MSATGGASGNPVTFSVNAATSSVCSMAASTVSFIGQGTCTVDAAQAGGAGYSAAPPAQQSFVVGPELQAITSSADATAVVGTPFSFPVTTSGAPVPHVTERGTLPKSLSFTAKDNGTAVISGVPTKAGGYRLTIIATFGKAKTKTIVTQAFTLTIDHRDSERRP